ncbi:hypothetical protein QN277_014334 [Acacia crassicarpa]|uniref:Uncharacterized protein n=1 Tax=Acacia crassicarpa TaxID=499986 RepID=A0AAE1IL63_9FABA|nr:hypothetical protein QN277_014334 [Acacia crassicarpa]
MHQDKLNLSGLIDAH